MRKRGFHYLNVYVQCRGYVHRIQIGKHGLSFVIANYNGGGSHGQQCLKLHTRIKEVLKNKCTEFRVIFQVAALKRAICVNNMRTLHWKHVNSRHCRHVVNI
ncbi:uncharacterized protein LOC134193198 [Corticium candelabrum]|nr:uncharacterized protein LOC134193198 [Corticium candelabrum]